MAIDEDRAPFVTLAFELYAAGDATIEEIADELTDRGLRTRATQRRPAGPISTSKLLQMLRDPYYTGIITYKGEQYDGRHEPIIDTALFESVQKLLDSHGHAGERRRIIHHYLKGTLWCGACYRRDRSISRMVIRRTISRSGEEYFYFFCVRTYKGVCNAKYSNMERIEEAVEEHYRTFSFDPGFLQAIRSTLADTLTDQESAQRLLRKQLDGQLQALASKEANLLDLAADGTLPQQKIRAKLREISAEHARVTEQIAHVADTLMDGVRYIEANLALLENPYELYLRAGDEVRRRLNQVFGRLFVEHNQITDQDMQEPLGDLLSAQTVFGARTQSTSKAVVHDLAQHSWAKYYKPNEKRAAPMERLSHSNAPRSPIASPPRGRYLQ